MYIVNKHIIRAANFLANTDDYISSINISNKITFNLNGFLSKCEDGDIVFMSTYTIGYFKYVKKTVKLWISIIKEGEYKQ